MAEPGRPDYPDRTGPTLCSRVNLCGSRDQPRYSARAVDGVRQDGEVIRASSADQPEDGRRGRPGWGAGARKRAVPPDPPTNVVPPRAPHPGPRPAWQSTPPRRATYRPDGYPPPD